MTTKLHFFITLLLSISLIQAQETTINTSMGVGYANQVFFKLSTETEYSFPANSWDIALLRTSAFNFGIRVNDGIGIEVYEASNTPSDWTTIDITNEASWTALNNSETTWSGGAFEQGSATYGFGEYNFSTHHIDGTIIFVLKYADGTYRKFINEDYAAGYTFKYATWDSNTSTWSADQTITVPNTNNPNNKFNYYSLQNNTEVVAEPALTDWDLVFTKYATDFFGDGSLYYPVTGVLHNENVEIAENDEPGGMMDNPNLTYSTNINTIGYDWKSFTGTSFSVDTEKAFYIKYADDTIYRLYFTAFSGSSSGDLTFVYNNVTDALSIEEVSLNVSFGIYPNPTLNKQVNLVYDVTQLSSNTNQVAIYSTTGQKVFETQLQTNSGFYNKTLDLSSLAGGIYMLQFTSGEYNVSKKIILK